MTDLLQRHPFGSGNAGRAAGHMQMTYLGLKCWTSIQTDEDVIDKYVHAHLNGALQVSRGPGQHNACAALQLLRFFAKSSTRQSRSRLFSISPYIPKSAAILAPGQSGTSRRRLASRNSRSEILPRLSCLEKAFRFTLKLLQRAFPGMKYSSSALAT